MTLSRLEVLTFRNRQRAVIEPRPGVTALFGGNCSGKTSLLEAIYFLGNFRSFRSSQASAVISDDSEFALIRGLTDQGDQLAVQRARNKRHQLRLNQAPLVRASDLATALPTVVFDPNTILLVLGEPERRRRFLNWGLFHVKPHFAESWRSWSRALDQRNRLLKVGYASDSLKEWTALLVKYSETIDFWRQQYVEGLQTAFVQLIAQLGINQPLTLEYRRGWPQDRDLKAALEEDLPTDLKRGFSQKGLHRSDLRLSVGGRPVAEHLSRGEAKMVAWLLGLAQLSLLPSAVSQKTIMLVDDPGSEIDPHYRQAMGDCMTMRASQVFTTSTTQEAHRQIWGTKLNQLFHVKQGIIEAIGG